MYIPAIFGLAGFLELLLPLFLNKLPCTCNLVFTISRGAHTTLDILPLKDPAVKLIRNLSLFESLAPLCIVDRGVVLSVGGIWESDGLVLVDDDDCWVMIVSVKTRLIES